MLAPAVSQGDGSDATYRFEALVAAQDRHFWFRARNELIGWAMSRYFSGAGSFLDLGCGTGGVSAALRPRLPQTRMVAADVLEEGLEQARTRLEGVTLIQMDARDVPFDSEFDVIGAFDVIEHFDDDEGVLGQMFKATRPGGGVIITVPQHQALWSAIDDFSRHRRRYSRRDLTEKLNRAGFHIRCVTSFVSALLPALLASRLRQPRGGECDPLSEFRIPAFLNRSLETVMTLERGFIRTGVRFPAGGSLLIVGYRPLDSN